MIPVIVTGNVYGYYHTEVQVYFKAIADFRTRTNERKRTLLATLNPATRDLRRHH